MGVTSGTYLAVSNYVGNYGGPAAIQPYTGTIVPGYNIAAGTTSTSTGTQLPSIGMQSITDGTSNTGLVSERLLALYPYGTSSTGALVYPQPTNGFRAVFVGTYPALPNSVTTANMMTANPALLFAQGCNALPSTTGSPYPGVVGVEMMAGHPGYPVLTSYMHWTAPNTPPCMNSADSFTSRILASALMARPRRTACTPAG